MKIRTDFVTNSSSSSFILAFKDKSDAYFKICDNFDVVNCDDCYDDFGNAKMLGKLLFDIKNPENKKTIDEVVSEYLESIEYYPVTYNVKEQKRKELGLDWEEFKIWLENNSCIIDEEVKAELQKYDAALREKLKGKDFIVVVEYEDHWPESEIFDFCKNLDDCVQIINEH